MKMILILFALFSLNTFASTAAMTIKEQDEFVTNVAKKIRRSYWIRSYEDVESSTTFMTKELLDEHFKNSNRYEDTLGEDEVSELYTCHYNSSCEVFLISVSSSYYSGYGVVAHFILLDTLTRKYSELEHTIYAE